MAERAKELLALGLTYLLLFGMVAAMLVLSGCRDQTERDVPRQYASGIPIKRWNMFVQVDSARHVACYFSSEATISGVSCVPLDTTNSVAAMFTRSDPDAR